MFAFALFALSIAQIALTPIALAVALAVVVWGALADVEIAIVVSKRRTAGARGQRVIASARTTPRRAARGAARGAVGALALARGAARWGETEQAARWADRARAAVDIGPAALTLAAVWALPWAMLTAPDGAGAALAVGGALAVARWGAAGGNRYRVDV